MSERTAALPVPVESPVATLLAWLRGDPRLADPRVRNSSPQFVSYALTLVQLTAAIAVVVTFRLEEPRFVGMLGLVLVGFAIHYWLPFRAKEPFLIALSLGGMLLLLSPSVAAGALLLGLFIYGVAVNGASYVARLAVILGLAGVLTWLRMGPGDALGIPSD